MLLRLALTAILFLARLSREDPRRRRILKNKRHTQPEASIDSPFEDAPVPTILPIYPSRGLFVLVFVGDGERFVRLFKKTWRKIPKQDRDLLLNQWKAEREVLRRESPKLPWPLISLRKKHRKFEESQVQRRITFGSASSTDITFYAPTFAIMPDNAFCIVIAHELAHRVMRLENPNMKPVQSLGKAYWAREEKVDAWLADWGFNVQDNERWCSENKNLLQELYWMVKLGLK